MAGEGNERVLAFTVPSTLVESASSPDDPEQIAGEHLELVIDLDRRAYSFVHKGYAGSIHYAVASEQPVGRERFEVLATAEGAAFARAMVVEHLGEAAWDAGPEKQVLQVDERSRWGNGDPAAAGIEPNAIKRETSMDMDGQRQGALRFMWVAIAMTATLPMLGRILDMVPTPAVAGAFVLVAILCVLGALIARGSLTGFFSYFLAIWPFALGTIGSAISMVSDDERTPVDFEAYWIAGAVTLLLLHAFAVGRLARADDRFGVVLKAGMAKELAGQGMGLGRRLLLSIASLAMGFGSLLATLWVAGSFEEQDLYGIVDANGAGRQQAVYSLISRPAATTGLALAFRDGKWGLLDREGREVVPPRFRELYVRAGAGVAEMRLEDKWGLVDLKGNTLIEPKYESITVVDRDFVWVKLGGKWGAIDVAGKALFAPEYASHGSALKEVVIATGADRRWRLLDRSGKPVATADFANVRVNVASFEETGLMAATADGKKWGYIDRTGTFVVEARFDNAYGFSKGGLARVMAAGKWGFVDRTGAFAIEPAYDGAEATLPNGLAPVKSGKLWGLVDRAGKVVVEPRYEKIEDAGQGLASVKVAGGKWGVVDAAGATVVEPRYAYRLRFRASGLARADLGNSRLGVIDSKGRTVIEPRYPDTSIWELEGEPALIAVLHPRLRLSVHDASGKQVVAPRADVDDIYSRSGDTLLLESIRRRYCALGEAICLP